MQEKIRQKALEISASQPGPFYIYDTASIRANCRSFLSIPYENKLITFASMANATPAFLQTVREEGVSIFVNSMGHLNRALEVGFEGSKIVFTSSGMDEPLMRAVEKTGAMVNLDSLRQLEQWRRLFPAKPAGIRCNIGELVEAKKTRGGYFLGKNSRLGLELHEIRELQNKETISGLHLYLGTDIIDLDYYTRCYEIIAELSALFPNLIYLDFGGGFGVSHEEGVSFDFNAYGQAVAKIMDQVSKDHGREILLILEPGRIIGGESAWFITKVTDVKHRAEMDFVGVNASTAQFTRPLMYPDDAFHPVEVLGREATGQPRPTSIFGCSTYSRDFFARDLELAPLQVGDVLAFGHAGSYCASSYTHFLGFTPAPEYFV